jgi:hypothetical protein
MSDLGRTDGRPTFSARFGSMGAAGRVVVPEQQRQRVLRRVVVPEQQRQRVLRRVVVPEWDERGQQPERTEQRVVPERDGWGQTVRQRILWRQ